MRVPSPRLLALTSLAFLSVACGHREQPSAQGTTFAQSQAALDVVGSAWTARIGTSGADAVAGVAIDSAGNVIVGGVAASGLDSQVSAGGQDGLIVKYSVSGARQWTRLVGTSQVDAVNGVAVGSSDNVYVAGYLRAPLDGQPNLGGQDLWVSKYDASGSRLWTRTTGSTTNDWASAVAVRGGAVYVVGVTGKSLPGSTAVGRNDVAVVRYDESGTLAWQKSFGSTLDDAASGVAVDAAGNVYVAGTTSGTLPGNTAPGGKDILVAKLDPTGSLLWIKQLGTSLDDNGTGVTIGPDGGIYVSGITAGALGGPQGGVTDAVLLKLDASGTQVWAKQLGGAALDEALGVAADSSSVYLTGRSQGQLPGANSGGLLNMFAAKYATDGTLQTVREYSGGNASGTTFAAGIGAANGRIVIAGVTSATVFDGVTGAGGNDGVLMSLCAGPGFSCELAGSCSTSHGGCTASQSCTPDVSGYVLCGCASGQTGSTVCGDVNECLVNNGGCDSRTTCTNTVGSRTCGACPGGFTGNGATGCVDVDECATGNGGCPNACANTPGSFQCTCGAGYTGDGVNCTDIDECATDHGGCDPLTTCTNTPGSLSCGDCPADYTGTGATGCICPAGYTGTGATGCTDVDECAVNNGGCDPLSICTNTAGSFVCGGCPAGYTGTGATGCVDINECTTNNGGCADYQTCSNTQGSRLCGCPAGFWDNGSACVALAPAWSARVGTSGADQINAVTMDSTGNVIVGGFAAANVDGQTTAGGQDGLVTKYSSTGSKQWTRLAGSSQADGVNGVAVGSSDSVYAAGYLRGTLDGQPNLGGTDVWVSRYDATGNRLWTRTTGSTLNDAANAVAVRGGAVYVAGLTGTSLPGSSAVGRNDIAIARYDESGTLTWQKSFGSTLDDAANGVAIDTAGNVYVAGTTGGSLPGNAGQGGKDIFVAKLSSTGSFIWMKQLGTAADDTGTGVTIGADDGIYVSGITAGALGGPQAGVTDAVLVKLDANGTLVWTKQLGGAALDEGLGVAADATSVFLTGRSLGQIPGANSGGLLNLFAARYALDGTLQTVREYSGGNSTGTTFSAGVAAARGRFVIAGGTSAGAFDGVNGFGNTDGVLMSLCADHNFACELAGTCTTNRGGCTTSQTCTQDGVGFVQCGCGAGYTGSQVCAEVNECLVNNGGCDALTSCTNTVGSRTCSACPSGYTGTGATGCQDTNECATNNGGCDAIATCTNTSGGRTCSCPAGFSGDGNSANSCFGSCSVCDAHADCSGGQPDVAATCSCRAGYQGTGTTCMSNTAIVSSPLPTHPDADFCGHHYEFGTPFHVVHSGRAIGLRFYRSLDWNEGTTVPGHLWASDGTLLGSVTYDASNYGWHTAYFAQPIILTAGQDYIAAYEARCYAFSLGTFSTPKDAGAITYPAGSGFYIEPSGQLPTNEIGSNTFPFADVLFAPDDACFANHGGCDALAACDSSSGSVVCGACPAGTTGNSSVPGGCVADCSTCDLNASCSNGGQFDAPAICTCNSGYAGDGLSCLDLDPCGKSNGGCDALVTCTNTGPGQHTCGSCPAGFIGDGQTPGSCEGTCERCAPNSTCAGEGQTDVAATCTCNEGYLGDGFTCTDACADNNGGCGGTLPTCGTSGGSVTCSCPADGPCQAVTSVRFLIEAAFCGGEIGGNGDNRFDLYAGDRLLGTVSADDYCYACEDGVTTEITFSDLQALKNLTPPNTCGDFIRVVEHDPVGTRLGFIRADITRIDGTVEKQCLVDYSGQGCAADNRNLCSGSDNQPRSSWSLVPDSDQDGVPDCAACPPGTILQGWSCVDPCAGNGGCDALTTCTPTETGHTCGSCPAGYTGSGQAAGTCLGDCSACDPHATCYGDGVADTAPSCACTAGWLGNGTSCIPDPCYTDNGGCPALQICLSDETGAVSCVCDAGTACDVATSVDFSIDASDCGGGNGDTAWDLYVGSALVQTVHTRDDCTCDQVNVTITDSAALAELTAPDTCGDFVRVVNHDPAGQNVQFVRARIHRAGSGTETFCLDDPTGNNCGADNVCDGSHFNRPAELSSRTDIDGDGVADCLQCPVGTVAQGITCVDTCTIDHGGCDTSLASCEHDVSGATFCQCFYGYLEDGVTCAPDPCQTDHGGCDVLATCDSTSGSAVCGACPAGTVGDGTVAAGCVAHCSLCDSHAFCDNDGTVDAPADCSCPQGFTGDGFVCTDIDECAIGTAECSAHASCTNTLGAYNCSCNAGYQGDGHNCTRINECATNNGGCDALVTCTLTDTSHTCGSCPAGTTGDGQSPGSCIGSCGTACDPSAVCSGGGQVDVPANCVCSGGTVGSGTSCASPSSILPSPLADITPERSSCVFTDMEIGTVFRPNVAGHALGMTFQRAIFNDTGEPGHLWSPSGQLLATVTFSSAGLGWQTAWFSQPVALTAGQNYVVSFESSLGCYAWRNDVFDASVGSGALTYPGGSTTNAVGAQPGGRFPTQPFSSHPYTFVDVIFQPSDPCQVSNGGCDALVTCTDSSGTAVCGVCPAGMTTSGNGTCVGACGTCDAHASCANQGVAHTAGACVCNSGYTGDGSSCTDINECDTSGACDANATCTNTPGSYTCACNTHYSGTGQTCVYVDECATSHGNCDALVSCTNTEESHVCGACPAGFSGDGQTPGSCFGTCDITCAANASCTGNGVDAAGACTCDDGYVGSPSSCVLPSSILTSPLDPNVSSDERYCVGVGLELGVYFEVNMDGDAIGIKYQRWAGSADDTVNGHLWDAASGELLGTVTFTSRAAGWQTAWFNTPISLLPGGYFVSFLTPNGCTLVKDHYFDSARVSDFITYPGGGPNGFVAVTDTPRMPNTPLSNHEWNYVDVIFVPNQ